MSTGNHTTRYYEPRYHPFVELVSAMYDIRDSTNPPQPERGYIYVLQAGDFYKIGRSKDVFTRLKQLQIQLPFRVRLVLAFEVGHTLKWEAGLHEMFKERRVNGEWFRLTDADITKLFRLSRDIHEKAKRRDQANGMAS